MYNEHQFLLQNIIPCFVMAVRIAHQNKCAGGIVLHIKIGKPLPTYSFSSKTVETESSTHVTWEGGQAQGILSEITQSKRNAPKVPASPNTNREQVPPSTLANTHALYIHCHAAAGAKAHNPS